MPVLGVITCEILEMEFAYLLTLDREVASITVLEDARSRRLIEELESRRVPDLKRIPHLHSYSPEPSSRLEVLVQVLDLDLHRTRKMLSQTLSTAARRMSPHVQALLLGYGRCGDALNDPRALLDLCIPVFIPLDGGQPVEDCVGCLLGKTRYCAEQHRIPGTFFMTPGWSRHWKRVFAGCSEAAIKRVFAGYERSLLVLTPAMEQSAMERNSGEFNHVLGMRVETCPGTMDNLIGAWKAAKASIFGRKGSEPRSEP